MGIPAITKNDASDKVRQVLQSEDKRITENTAAIAATSSFTDRGDPSSFDFDETTLTDNTNWNNLDLSSIVDSGAKAVLLLVKGKDGSTSSLLSFRKNDNSNIINLGQVRTQVAAVVIQNDLVIPLDDNGVIEIKVVPKPTDWNDIDITVKGWWA